MVSSTIFSLSVVVTQTKEDANVGFLRVLLYALTGRFSEMKKAWYGDKYVQIGVFDKQVEKAKLTYSQLEEAVAELMTLDEDNREELRNKTKELQSLEDVKMGAVAKVKKIVAALKAAGKSGPEIESDSEYLKWSKAYDDAESEQDALEERIKELEERVEGDAVTLSQYKAEMSSTQRLQESLKREKNETLADMAVQDRRKKVAQLLSGVALDSSDKELQEIRDARKRIKSQAKLATEIAGTDAKNQRAELMREARSSRSASKFAGLVGLEDAPAEGEKLASPKLPE
jgi:chromosome segregation ATPase